MFTARLRVAAGSRLAKLVSLQTACSACSNTDFMRGVYCIFTLLDPAQHPSAAQNISSPWDELPVKVLQSQEGLQGPHVCGLWALRNSCHVLEKCRDTVAEKVHRLMAQLTLLHV
jgi:hypothetical protein